MSIGLPEFTTTKIDSWVLWFYGIAYGSPKLVRIDGPSGFGIRNLVRINRLLALRANLRGWKLPPPKM